MRLEPSSAANAEQSCDAAMENNGDYNAILTSPSYGGEVIIRIEKDRLDFRGVEVAFALDFALIVKIGTGNFRLRLVTEAGDFILSRLGYDFDDFCHQLQKAFCARSEEALFVAGIPGIVAEGEYAYADNGGAAKGTASLRLFEDCVTILPPDRNGRRIPLCFAAELSRENYTLKIVLDTAERYELMRLGRDTDAFLNQLQKACKESKQRYEAQLAAIVREAENYDGEVKDRLEILAEVGGAVLPGTFAPAPGPARQPLSAWFAAVGRDRAAVELVTGEQTATYLYRFGEEPGVFLARLRHAMEAVGDHREVIFLPEITAAATPLYDMAVKRSAALTFLRAANAGRLIHNGGWRQKLADFFEGIRQS